MAYKTILVEKRAPLYIITLNRPEKLNAINVEMKRELYQALDDAEADKSIRVVILNGAGRAFSSGHDMDAPESEHAEFVSLKQEEKLFHLDKPVIAAVHGYTLGDGMQEALLCDIIVASEDAILGFIGARVGGLCYGSFTILPAVVGRKKASELFFTAGQISADEACRMGLVNKVVPAEQLMATAIGIAEKICEILPLSVKYSKRAMMTPLITEAHRRALEEGRPLIREWNKNRGKS